MDFSHKLFSSCHAEYFPSSDPSEQYGSTSDKQQV